MSKTVFYFQFTNFTFTFLFPSWFLLALKLDKNMNFCIFLKISERYIFASRGPNMRLNSITSYIRWKVCVQTFQKFLKNLKLGNFTRLRASWLKKPAKTKNIWYEQTVKTHLPEVSWRKKLFIFFYPYKHPKTWWLLFFDIMFWLRKNWYFFLKIWSFCLLLPQIPFLAIKMVKNNIFR